MPPSDNQIIITLMVDDQGTRVIREFKKTAQTELKGTEEQTKKTASGMISKANEIGMAFNEAGRRLSMASLTIAGGLIASTKGLMSMGKEMWTLHQRTGIAVETLSEFSLSAQKSGTSIQAVARGMRSMATEMAQAQKGGGEAARTFRMMDIELKDSNGRLRQSEDILKDVAEYFSKMENEAEKTALAMKLFGRYGMELIPMLNLGKAGLDANAEAAKRLGYIFSNETAKAADNLDAKMTELGAATKGVFLMFLDTVMPVLSNYAQKVTQAAVSIRHWIELHPALSSMIVKVVTNTLLWTSVLTPLIWGIGKTARSIVSLVEMGGVLKKMFSGLTASYQEMLRYQTALRASMIANTAVIGANIGAVSKLSLAFKAFWASLGPIGWAIIALTALISIGPKLVKLAHSIADAIHGHKQLTGAMEKTLKLSRENEMENNARIVSLQRLEKEVAKSKELQHEFNAELAYYKGDASKMLDQLEKGNVKYSQSLLKYFNDLTKTRQEEIAEEVRLANIRAVNDANINAERRKTLEAQYPIIEALVEQGNLVPRVKEMYMDWLKTTKEELWGVSTTLENMMDQAGVWDMSQAQNKLLDFSKMYENAVHTMGLRGEDAFKLLGGTAKNAVFIIESFYKAAGKPMPDNAIKEMYDNYKKLEGQAEAAIPTMEDLNEKYEGFRRNLIAMRGTLTPELFKKHRMELDEMGMSIGRTTGAERGWFLNAKAGLVTLEEEKRAINDLKLQHQDLDASLALGEISRKEYDKLMGLIAKSATELGIKLHGLTRAEQGSYLARTAVVRTLEDENKAFGVIRLTIAGLTSDYNKGIISEKEYVKGMAEQIKAAAAMGKTVKDLASAERGYIMLQAGGMKTLESERMATQQLQDSFNGLNAAIKIGKISMNEYTEQMKALVSQADKGKKAIEGLTEAQKQYYLILASGVLTLQDEQKIINDSITRMAVLGEGIGKNWSLGQAVEGMNAIIAAVEKLNPELAEMMKMWRRKEILEHGTALDKERMAAGELGVTLSQDLHKAFKIHAEDLMILTHASGTAKISQLEIAEAIGTMISELEKAGEKKPLKALADGMAEAYKQMQEQAVALYGEDIGKMMFPDLPKNFWPKWIKENMSPTYLKASMNTAMAFLAGAGQVWGESLMQEAAQVRASITENMDFAEKKAIEHRAVALENFAALVSGISLMAGNISNSFDEVYESLDTVADQSERTGLAIIKAIGPQVWGMIGGAIGQMISGAKDSFASLGSAIGSSIGSIVGKIPGIGQTFFGKILGEVGGLLGGLIGGLFKKKKTPEQKAAEEYQKWVDEAKRATSGLGRITTATAKAIADFRKEMKEAGKTISEATAQAYLFSKIMEDIGITVKNVEKFWGEATKAIDAYKKGQLTAKQATESLTNSFTMLVEHARLFGTEGSKAMTDFIAKVQKSGLAVKEVTDYIKAQLGIVNQEVGTAAGGLLKMATYYMTGLEELYAQQMELQTQLEDRLLRGMARVKVQQELAKVKKQIADLASGSAEEVERLGRRTFTVFAEMMLQGASFNEAMESLGPTLDLLIRRYEIMGQEAPGGIKEIMNLRKLQNENKTLFDAIQGNLDVMTAVSNYRKLTQEEWADAQASVKEYYDQLRAAGATEQEALIAIQPTLERMVFLHGQYNDLLYSSDVSGLIDIAKATGLVTKQQLSLNEIMLGGFAMLIQAMGFEVPAALEKYRKRLVDFENEETAREERIATRRAQMEEERRRNAEEGKLGVSSYTSAVIDSTVRIDSGLNDVADEVGRTGDAFEDAGSRAEDSLRRVETGIEGIRTALDETTASLERFATTVSGIENVGVNVNANTLSDETISAQGGGAWRVTGREQLFRAHQGETVRVSRGDESENTLAILNRLEAAIQARPVVSQEININVSTVDAESFRKLTKDKLVPELMRLSKAEVFKTYPASVREY